MNDVSRDQSARSCDPFPSSSAPGDEPISNGWAGGRRVEIPGLGMGTVIRDGGPGARVIEVTFPAPASAVFRVAFADGPRTVVLTDPRVSPGELARTLRAADALEHESEQQEDDRTDAPPVGDGTPRAIELGQVVGLPTQRTGFRQAG